MLYNQNFYYTRGEVDLLPQNLHINLKFSTNTIRQRG